MENQPSKPAAFVELAKLIDLATPFAVRTAVTLRLPELISEGASGLDTLAERTGTHKDSLERLLRHLVRVGLFAEAAPGTYALTDLSQRLLGEDNVWFRDWLNLEGPGTKMDLAFAGMLHSVRTGQAAYDTVHGTSFWDDYQHDPDLRRFFGDVMAANAWQTGPILAAEFDWAPVRTVIDIGGGIGALLGEVLRANPHLHGEVLDLPPVAQDAERALRAAGLADRAAFVPGSFFDPLPSGRDVYMVSRVLTDWNDEDATRILRRCAEAAGVRGRVLIVEVLAADDYASYDLQSLVLLGGRERTVADFERLAKQARLAVIGSRDWPGGLVLIECASPDSAQ